MRLWRYNLCSPETGVLRPVPRVCAYCNASSGVLSKAKLRHASLWLGASARGTSEKGLRDILSDLRCKI